MTKGGSSGAGFPRPPPATGGAHIIGSPLRVRAAGGGASGVLHRLITDAPPRLSRHSLPDSLYNAASPRQPVMPVFRITLRKTPSETLRPCLVCQVNREQAVHDEAGDDPQHARRGLVAPLDLPHHRRPHQHRHQAARGCQRSLHRLPRRARPRCRRQAHPGRHLAVLLRRGAERRDGQACSRG